MYVTPKRGLKVRDPDLRDFLPEDGREVPDSLFWARRVQDGDVRVGKPEAAALAAAAAPATVAHHTVHVAPGDNVVVD